MSSYQQLEKDLLNLVTEAIKHPDIPVIDFGLSGRILVDHVIGRFEQTIDNCNGTDCPQIIKEGYRALQKLYPLHFRSSYGNSDGIEKEVR